MDSFLVQLNSDDAERLNGDYLSHVQFNFANVFRKDRHVERVLISVENAQIPCSFFAIHSENDRLNYSYDGADHSIQLTHGNYNAYGLVTELKARLTANFTPFTIVSVNSTTGRLTMETASYPFTLYADSTINKILGIGPNNLVDDNEKVTCPISVNLLGITAIRISSSKLPVSGLTSKGLASTSVLAMIPVDNASASFGLLSYTNMTLFQPVLRLSHLSQFDIQLFDQDGTFIDFRGVGWSMTLKFDLILKPEPTKSDGQLLRAIQALADSMQQPQADESQEQVDTQEQVDETQEQVDESGGDADMGDLSLLLEGQRNAPQIVDEDDGTTDI